MPVRALCPCAKGSNGQAGEARAAKLWHSCTSVSDIEGGGRVNLAKCGALGANTLHTLTGFPGLGI